MDTILAPLMDDLRQCAVKALEDTQAGTAGICVSSLVPGTLAVADWCTCTKTRRGAKCEGMLWVRLDRLYPSGGRFPSQDTSTTSCVSVLAAVLEVGVYRCQPTMGADGTPPSEAEQTQAAIVQADDALALHKAIACCRAITSRPNLLGSYLPRDGGSCGGGSWTVTVQLFAR